MPRNYTTIVKHVGEREVCLGDIVTYTITIQNIHTRPLTEVVFRDMIPPGLTFQQGSVEINGGQSSTADPQEGFPLPNIIEDDIVTVTFNAIATTIPQNNPVINIAHVEFRTRNENDDQVDTREPSNPIPITIMDCGCDEGSCDKTMCKIFSISLPITVKPFARKETPEITCVDQMTISNGHVHCPDPPHDFEYTLTQRIRVELPVAFGAEVCYEEPCAEDNGQCEIIP